MDKKRSPLREASATIDRLKVFSRQCDREGVPTAERVENTNAQLVVERVGHWSGLALRGLLADATLHPDVTFAEVAAHAIDAAEAMELEWARRTAVPAIGEDEQTCPHDPDGLHHVGCGCNYASPDDAPEVD